MTDSGHQRSWQAKTIECGAGSISVLNLPCVSKKNQYVKCEGPPHRVRMKNAGVLSSAGCLLGLCQPGWGHRDTCTDQTQGGHSPPAVPDGRPRLELRAPCGARVQRKAHAQESRNSPVVRVTRCGAWASGHSPRAGRTVLPASSPGFSFQMAEQLMTLAYDNGINLFDTAEVYAAGKYVSLLVGKSGAATALRGGFPHAPPPLPTFLNSQRLQDVLFPWDWSRRTGTPVTCKLPTVHTPG